MGYKDKTLLTQARGRIYNTRMRTLMKAVGWVLLAPAAWIFGTLLIIFCLPGAYILERHPLTHVPPHLLTEQHVAELNQALKASIQGCMWSPAPLVEVFPEECVLAVPTAMGELELIHVYPALAWRTNTPETDWKTVVQKWITANETKTGGEQ